MTAAATTGPANGPRPTSSTPAQQRDPKSGKPTCGEQDFKR
jgi:hypothetical protein